MTLRVRPYRENVTDFLNRHSGSVKRLYSGEKEGLESETESENGENGVAEGDIGVGAEISELKVLSPKSSRKTSKPSWRRAKAEKRGRMLWSR